MLSQEVDERGRRREIDCNLMPIIELWNCHRQCMNILAKTILKCNLYCPSLGKASQSYPFSLFLAHGEGEEIEKVATGGENRKRDGMGQFYSPLKEEEKRRRENSFLSLSHVTASFLSRTDRQLLFSQFSRSRIRLWPEPAPSETSSFDYRFLLVLLLKRERLNFCPFWLTRSQQFSSRGGAVWTLFLVEKVGGNCCKMRAPSSCVRFLLSPLTAKQNTHYQLREGFT